MLKKNRLSCLRINTEKTLSSRFFQDSQLFSNGFCSEHFLFIFFNKRFWLTILQLFLSDHVFFKLTVNSGQIRVDFQRNYLKNIKKMHRKSTIDDGRFSWRIGF